MQLTETTAIRLLEGIQRLEIAIKTHSEIESWKTFIIVVATAELIAVLLILIGLILYYVSGAHS